jgi:hypothetical protein
MTHPEAAREVFILQKGQLPQLYMHAAIAELTAAGDGAPLSGDGLRSACRAGSACSTSCCGSAMRWG